jgi:outer membrane lipoprotein-sorting protein
MVSFCANLAGAVRRGVFRSSIRHMKPRFHFSVALFCLAFSLAAATAQAQSEKFLDQWIAAQTNLHTWSADVVETRALKTLSQPLVSTGKVWVAMPNHFRWELGQPAQTIALRQPDQLFLIYPRLKRVEKYPLVGNQPGPWRDALALLDASFPRSRAELESHFQLLSVIQTNATIQLTLQPRSQAARKFMNEISVAVHTNDFSPASTELKFSDGSSMRNDFTNGVINPPLNAWLFETNFDTNFTIVEPLQ